MRSDAAVLFLCVLCGQTVFPLGDVCVFVVKIPISGKDREKAAGEAMPGDPVSMFLCTLCDQILFPLCELRAFVVKIPISGKDGERASGCR